MANVFYFCLVFPSAWVFNITGGGGGGVQLFWGGDARQKISMEPLRGDSGRFQTLRGAIQKRTSLQKRTCRQHFNQFNEEAINGTAVYMQMSKCRLWHPKRHQILEFLSLRGTTTGEKLGESASLTFRVLSQLPKCIHNSIDAQLKHGLFLLENYHCHFTQYL